MLDPGRGLGPTKRSMFSEQIDFLAHMFCFPVISDQVMVPQTTAYSISDQVMVPQTTAYSISNVVLYMCDTCA